LADGSVNLISEFFVIPYYWAHQLTANSGSIISGVLSDTYFDDANRLILSEINATPGFDYVFEFQGIPCACIAGPILRLKGYYQGNPAHKVKIQAYNWTTLVYEDLTTRIRDMPSAASDQNYGWITSSEYFSSPMGDSTLRIKIIHISPGNVTHTLNINYLWLDDTTLSTHIHSQLIVRQTISKDLYAKFETVATAQLKGVFTVRHTDTKDIYAKFEAQATASLKGIFETAQWEDLNGIFITRLASSAALKGVFTVRYTATRDLYAKFEAQAVKDLYAKLIVRHSSGYPEANIKCTFSLYKPYANLFSKLRVRGAGTAELKGVFRVTAETLLAVFHVGQDSETLHGFFHVGQDSAELKGVFDVGQNHGDLYAKFEAQVVRDLYAKFEAQHCTLLKAIFIVKQGTRDLYAKFESQAIADLYAKFTPKRSTSNALKAELEIGLMLNEELKAVFTVKQEAENLLAVFRIRSTLQDMYNLIGYNMPELLNDVENIGRGFIGSPAPLQTESGTPTGRISVKAVSSHGAGQYKEIRFGWRKEDPIYDAPPCVGERDYEELVYEPWDWDERSYITSVVADTHIRLRFARHFAEGGWTLADINYGTVDYLKASYYDYVYPGDCFDKYVNLDDEESFIRFNVGIPSLDRLGYARFEWFRYYGSNCHQLMGLRRIASCEEVPETYQYWNPAIKIGGCDYGPLKGNIWSESALKWDNSGRNNLSMGGGQPYMGLSAFVNNSPEVYYGLTAENNEWDMFEITELLEGWVNGDFKNNGIGIRGEMTCNGWDARCSNRVNANTPRFYSRRSSDTRRPRIMLQYIPENSVGKWSFRGNNYWEIDTDDPLVDGGGSLRLRDWSKRNYQNIYEIKPAVTLNTSKTLIEGSIKTWIRINRDDWPELRAYDQGRCEDSKVEYTTARENYIDIFFRYQDSDNHCKVRINPRSRVSKLIETISGTDITRESWTTAINVGEKKHIRIFWALNDDELVCCGQMWNASMEIWRTFFTYTWTPNSGVGGDVRIESWDATIDDTIISEVSS